MFNINFHPSLKESTYRESKDSNEAGMPDDQMMREITAHNFMKYRLDPNFCA